MIRTSLSPSDVTPAAYLLPSAISLSSRAATRGSTTPMRTPLLMRDEPVALGGQLDRVARVDLGELARRGEVGQEREAGLAGLLDEDADRGLAALLRRDGLLAGGDEEHLEPVDVALGDPVRRIERERGLVVLAGGAELAQLPERLGQAVLGLGVGPELEQPAVGGRGLGPLGGRRLGDRLVGQLPLLAVQVDGALAGVSTSGKVTRRSSFRGAAGFGVRVGSGRARGHAGPRGGACFLAPSGRRVKRCSVGAEQQVPDRDDRRPERRRAARSARSSGGRAGARAPC